MNTTLTLTLQDRNGKRVERITKFPTIMGKDSQEADVLVSSNYISRNHCQIDEINGQLFLKDLSSTNGTFVNDRQTSEENVLIKVGDTIQLGIGNDYSEFALISIDDIVTSNITPIPGITPLNSSLITPTVSEDFDLTNDTTQSAVTGAHLNVNLAQIVSIETTNKLLTPKCKLTIKTKGHTESVDINDFPCLIGRDPQDERFKTKVTILDNSNTISKEHLILTYFDGQTAKFINLGTNGCIVNANNVYGEFEVQFHQDFIIGDGNMDVKLSVH